MVFKRRLDEECPGLAREVVEAEDSELGGSLDRKTLLVARYKEGRSPGSSRRLHLQESRLAIVCKRENIEAGSVAILPGYPRRKSRRL